MTAPNSDYGWLGPALDALSEFVFITDHDGFLQCWSDLLPRLTGYTHAELRQMCVSDLVAPEDRTRVSETLGQIEATGTGSVTAALITHDGTRLATTWRYTRPPSDAALNGIHGVGRICTDRVPEDTPQLFAEHPAPTLLVTDGAVVAANPAAAHTLDAPDPDALRGQRLADFVAVDDHETLHQYLSADAPQWKPAVLALTESDRVVALAASPTMYGDQPAMRVALTPLPADAVASARAQAAFLAAMSHEIRTPLTSILGFADLLTEQLDGDAHAMAESIAASGHRLLDTLNEILDLVALERGTLSLTPEVFDAAALAREVVAALRDRAARKNLSVGLTLDTSPPVLMKADREAVEKIIRHLTVNAIKFTEKGHVELSLDRDANDIRLRIEDTGIGIQSDFLPHIFDRFAQESDGIEREHDGTGLGLTITKHLVDQLDGTISVESEPAVGTTFTVCWPHRCPINNAALFPIPPANGHSHEPLHAADVAELEMRPAPSEPLDAKASVRLTRPLETDTPAPNEETAPPASTSDIRLLLLEDDPITRRLLERILSTTYTVETATTANEALRCVEDQAYDAFVFDINLGERRTGIEVLQAIRQMPPYRTTPAVACTAYAFQDYKEAFREAGFDAVIPKPVTKQKMVDTLNAVLAAGHTPSHDLALDFVDGIDLPPLPTTVPAISELIAQDNDTFDVEALIDILEQDQIASMWLLSHINSAYYNLNTEVTSIRRAVLYAGFRTVCNLVLTGVMKKSFSSFESPQAQAVYQHTMKTSLAAASFSKTLAQHLNLPDPDITYTGAFLSRLGRLLLLEKYGDGYAELWYREDASGIFAGPPPVGQEILQYGIDHVRLGIAALQQNDVSDAIIDLIRYHRDPEHVYTTNKQGVRVVAAGLDAAEALYLPERAADSFQHALEQSRPLKTLAAHHSADRNELVALLVSDADRIRWFADQILTHRDVASSAK